MRHMLVDIEYPIGIWVRVYVRTLLVLVPDAGEMRRGLAGALAFEAQFESAAKVLLLQVRE